MTSPLPAGDVVWHGAVRLGDPRSDDEGGRRHLAICGFMGVGKSSLARLLAPVLGRRLVDIDAEAEGALGCSIQECFRRGQQDRFRSLEADLVASALAGEDAVIALGGGALQRPQTLTRLRAQALLLYLHVPWEELRAWIESEARGRPLLQGSALDDIEELYNSRLPIYRQAHLEVHTGRSGVDRAAEVVLEALAAGPAA